MKIIIGISAFYHDSAAAIIKDGIVIAAAQEERFSRIKNDANFPFLALKSCLKETNLELKDIDAVVFYDKPMLKFERLLETYYHIAPKGLFSFLKSMPIWFNEKLFIKKNIEKQLLLIGNFNKEQTPILFSEHHLSHAASCFFTSPFSESAILTVDGVGEWATASLAIGKNNEITTLKELHFPASLGLLYSSFTFFLGFKVNSGEYKMMGLAPYGNVNSDQTQAFIEKIKTTLVVIHEDGSLQLNPKYFDYLGGLKMIKTPSWEKLFGIKKRNPESEIAAEHCNMAFAAQYICEEILIKMAKHCKTITNQKNLCLSGGVALNCVANGKLKALNIFENIFIQPAAGDSGAAIGAAMLAYHQYFKQDFLPKPHFNPYLGPQFKTELKEILNLNNPQFSKAETSPNFEDLTQIIAHYLFDNKVVAWFQGRMEFGPRALGNRSILANPLGPNMQTTLNLKIKKREAFRPFAPAVLEEDAPVYFKNTCQSPYMLFVDQVKPAFLFEQKTSTSNIFERLNQKRSVFQSITHVDGSARVQTVSEENNPKFYALLTDFKKLSSHGMLINTSFNVRGEPIVCSPQDAYNCFINTEIDCLVIENIIFMKHAIQP